jgi:hypothetical protein
MAEGNMLDKILEAKKRVTPEQGFNVVGIDTYEMPGEEPFVIGHYDTVEEANAMVTAYKQSYPDTPVYVYGVQAAEQEVQKSVLQKFHDFTVPIVQRDTQTYERIQRVLIARHGYEEADFEKDGELYGWSANELLDLILEDLRGK